MRTVHNFFFIAILCAGLVGLFKSSNFTQFALVACGTVALFVLYLAFYMKVEEKRTGRKVQKTQEEIRHLISSCPQSKKFGIKDNISGDLLGEISGEDLFFLVQAFSGQGMKDNDFYFLEELCELFIKEEKPGESLSEFLRKALKGREEAELHWEKPEKGAV
ncbi:hypothetical protein JW890_09555 [candidate division WOR-3 bacterium]|nr:hypothetical protein [candidate division WOR-3 bacterium]